MKKILLSVFAIACLASCTRHVIDRYIYLDDNGIYHVDSECDRLRHGKDCDGHDIYSKHPISIDDFRIENLDNFHVCANCVDDENYERLIKIDKENIHKAARLWLYNHLSNANYSVPSFHEFCNLLYTKPERRHVFEIALMEHWDVGETFTEFEIALGYRDPSDNSVDKSSTIVASYIPVITKIHQRTSKGRGY